MEKEELIAKYQKHRDFYKKEMEYAEEKISKLDKYEFNELLHWECEKSFNKCGYLTTMRIIKDLDDYSLQLSQLQQDKEELIKLLEKKTQNVHFDISGYVRGEFNARKEILSKLKENKNDR